MCDARRGAGAAAFAVIPPVLPLSFGTPGKAVSPRAAADNTRADRRRREAGGASPPPHALPGDRRGAAAMLGTALLPVLIGGAAIALDTSALHVHRHRLQLAANTAALAALGRLGNDDVVAAAQARVAAKMPALGRAVLSAADVQPGNYDAATSVFTAGGTPVNAVRTTARMTTANGNRASFVVAPVLGLIDAELSASAVATEVTVPGPEECRVYDPAAAADVTATDLATLAEGGPPASYREVDGHPLVRLDNAFDGPNVIAITSIGGVPKTASYEVPRRGRFLIVLYAHDWADLPAGGSIAFKITGAASGAFRTGVHRWANRIRDAAVTQPCVYSVSGGSITRKQLVSAALPPEAQP